MKNSDFIQMSQCHLYSIKFPTDKVKETLDNAKFALDDPYITVELVKNPMTGEKVHQLENGLFFTLRTTFKKVTRDLLTAKIYELKQRLESDEGWDGDFIPTNEKQWVEIATAMIYQTVPYSSELVNVFYSPEKELLITNNGSKHSKLALNELIRLFGLVGFRSIVVSDEKLGLHTRLENYLGEGKPMFKFLNFRHEASLRKVEENYDETFLTCRHLDAEVDKAKALEALRNGFKVQSVLMWYDDGHFAVNFKLDSHLKIRAMKFVDYADTARQLNSSKFTAKTAILTEYLECQLNALLKIAECTVLEFVNETKLESFV